MKIIEKQAENMLKECKTTWKITELLRKVPVKPESKTERLKKKPVNEIRTRMVPKPKHIGNKYDWTVQGKCDQSNKLSDKS